MTVSTVAEELRHNPRLTKSKEEFVQIMKSLGLTKPKKMGKTLLLNYMYRCTGCYTFVCQFFYIWHHAVNSRKVSSQDVALFRFPKAVLYCFFLWTFITINSYHWLTLLQQLGWNNASVGIKIVWIVSKKECSDNFEFGYLLVNAVVAETWTRYLKMVLAQTQD